MKSKIIHSSIRIILLVFCFSLILPFQNCAVYQSDGRKAFNSSLEEAENKGCYPYVDTNLAMGFIGAVDGSMNVYKSRISGEDAFVCDFITTAAGLDYINHVNCKISVGSADNAMILVADGEAAFSGIAPGSIWVANPVRVGFVGTTHSGYVAVDGTDYIVKYLSLNSGDTKGVGCSVKMSATNYANATYLAKVKSTLSNLALEMAVNNQD